MLRILFACILLSIQLPAISQKSRHVILISIDGFRPDFYLDPQFPASFLQQMAREGTHAKEVMTVFPSVTYPSHTTIITGAKPSTHGIYYNSAFEPEGQTGTWYWDESQIKTKTLWDAAREKSLKTASVSWPVSVGAPIDYNIPEVWSLEKGVERFTAMRAASVPKGIIEEIEREATGKLNDKTFNGDYFSRDDKLGMMGAYLFETYKPNLLTIHLIGTDHFQHEMGRSGDKVNQSVQVVDRAIGLMLEAVERAGLLEQTTFIITGDHGFVDIHQTLSPNVWLAEAGLIDKKDPNKNWKARFHTSGASAFLHLRNPKDETTLKKVQEILAQVPEEVKPLFKVLNKEQLGVIGADPNAALALNPAKGVSMNSRIQGDPLGPGKGGTHGFLNDIPEIRTGFVAWGAGIREKEVIASMALEDVAPVVAELLQLSMQYPHGVLHAGILK